MKLFGSVCALALVLAGCSHSPAPTLKATAYGVQIVEVSGSKQWAQVGSTLSQPLIVQVNGADGNPVAGALVAFRGENLQFNPSQALSDASGQVTTNVRLGFLGGDYQVIVESPKATGEQTRITLREIGLGYEQAAGKSVNDKYCIRCHDPESTPERVSNLDNLSPAPHQFTDGATLNHMSDADLMNMITHGGLALGKSPQMPPYGATLKPAEVKAALSYIRAVADPPYQVPGVVYGK